MGDHNGNNSEHVATPRTSVSHDGKIYDVTREGLAEILIPQQSNKGNRYANDGELIPEHKNGIAQQSVFYNPIQQYNRDLSVLAIRAFTEDLVAVRSTRQEYKELQVKKAQECGKKRKRGRDRESTKKEAEEGDISVLEADTKKSRKLDLNGMKTGESHKDNSYVPIGATEEGIGTDVENSKDSIEDVATESNQNKGAASNSGNPPESRIGKNDSLDNGVSTLDVPNGPKSSKPTSFQSIRILDALSATGLRALRYAKEIPLATSLVANDLSSSATASIKVNIAHNDLTSKVTATKSDALEQMYSTMSRANGRMPQPFHVIDIDPYGTAAPFLDAAVHAIADGGLLCITCTDAGIFASIGYIEKTYSQYGGLPVKGPHAHEAALRLILHALATTAARRGIAIEPLLSLSIDFYVRIFVRVHKSPAEVKFLASKTIVVYQCESGCGSWSTQFLAQARGQIDRNGETIYKFKSALGPSAGTECEHCGFKTHVAGPMWGGALHNPFFIQRILDTLPGLDKEVYRTVPRLEGMLSMALEESLDDPWVSIVESKKQKTSSEAPQEASPSAATERTAVVGENSSLLSDSVPTRESSRPVPPLPAHYRVSHPFFIHPPSLSRTLNTNTPSDAQLRGALRHLGYRTSRSHAKAGSIITNAPFSVIWEIMREWARRESKDGREHKLGPNTAGAGIMRKNRSRRDVNAAKAEMVGKIARADSTEELKRELEAALYRLNSNSDKNNTTTSTHLAPPTPITGTSDIPKDSNSTHHEPQHTDATTTDSTTTNHPPLPLHALDIRFDETLGRDSAPELGGANNNSNMTVKTGKGREKKKRLLRYQTNPRKNWGPQGRAKG